MNDASRSDRAYKAYLVFGVVAAAVSAATAAYIFWSRARHIGPQVETVQELLDRCHNQVREIEHRLTELRPRTPGTASKPT